MGFLARIYVSRTFTGAWLVRARCASLHGAGPVVTSRIRCSTENGRLSFVEVDFGGEEIGEDLGEPVRASCDADDLASVLSTMFANYAARLADDLTLSPNFEEA